MIIAPNRDLPGIIDTYRRHIHLAGKNDEIEKYCRKTGMTLISAAFHLLIEKEGFWTDNIRKRYKVVKKHFPENDGMFKDLYIWIKKPISDKLICIGISISL